MSAANENESRIKDQSKAPISTSGHSVLILFIFFIAILALLAIGLGLTYLCYRQSVRKKREREEEEQQVVLRRNREQHPYRAIASAAVSNRRGNLNWYSPNPKDETALLLDGSIIPVHMQTNYLQR